MLTKLLKEIIELLKGIHDYMSSIKDSVDHVSDLLDALSAIIESMESLMQSIESNVNDIADATDVISNNSVLIEDHTNDLLTSVNIMKQNDIDHYLANETALAAIQSLTQLVATAVSVVRDTLIHTDNQVSGIKIDTATIANYSASIADSTGQSAASLDDIATNTLTCANRLTSLCADSTNVIALLQQLIQEVHDHG